MAIKDLREYISRLEEYGELQRIEAEVDWNFEAGAITRRANELGAPAPLMSRIKGYPEGYALLGGPVAGSKVKGPKPWRRLAIALEMDPDCSYWEIVEEFKKRIEQPIKPVIVSDGPCKENILLGKEVNLFKFPVPMQHDGDGGRYLSFHCMIFKDPDSDWVNWAMYRAMIQTRNKLGGHILPHSHGGMIYYRKYEARNKPMPFCICIGGEPLNTIIGALSIPVGVNEVDIAGGFRREPVEMIPAETNDLLVPAHAEIILEGEIRPYERWDEGPFGEYHGFMQGPRMPAPVYRINAITYRDNPILPFCCAGTPVDDCAAIMHVSTPAELLRIYRDKLRWPIKAIYTPPSGLFNLLIVSARIPYPGFAIQIAHALQSNRLGFACHKIIVVDEDIDPTNLDEIWQALATRLHPVQGIQTTPYAVGHPILTYLNLRERQYGLGAQAIFDCTRSALGVSDDEDWGGNSSFRQNYPAELQRIILEKWVKEYGYEKQDYRIA